MTKDNIDMVAIPAAKANAQNLVCFIAFIITAAIAGILIVAACVLPAIITVTKIICWVVIAMTAAAIGMGLLSCWIYRNTLQ